MDGPVAVTLCVVVAPAELVAVNVKVLAEGELMVTLPLESVDVPPPLLIEIELAPLTDQLNVTLLSVLTPDTLVYVDTAVKLLMVAAGVELVLLPQAVNSTDAAASKASAALPNAQRAEE
jgi:hypothetical protein